MFAEIDGAAHVEKENNQEDDVDSLEDAAGEDEASEDEPEAQAANEEIEEAATAPALKLNYHCMKQLDDETNNSNVFINTQNMRSNEFVLCNFVQNVLPKSQVAAGAVREYNKVIMTQQKTLFPQQMRSLIVAYES